MESRFSSDRSAEGDHFTAKNEGEAIAVFSFFHVVRGDKDGDAVFGHMVNEIPELPARDRIDAGRGLIKKQDGRLVQNGAAQRQTLFPAAWKGAGDEILLAFQVGHFKRPFDAVFEFGRRNTVETGEEAEIFNDVQIVVERELLRHVADVLTHCLGLAVDIESGN